MYYNTHSQYNFYIDIDDKEDMKIASAMLIDKSIDYSTVFAITPYLYNYTINFFGFEIHGITLICFFFFIAATGKSAQIGLHT